MRYYSSFTVLLGWLFVASCSSAGKIPCPTYADSQPEKKHKGRPGSQKPEVPRPTKSKSGVLPTDGGGKHMHHTK
ncbi:MAG: hypothetical protein U0T84_04450 [Chitinophagales bacterium]